jgi:hypothetical protein
MAALTGDPSAVMHREIEAQDSTVPQGFAFEEFYEIAKTVAFIHEHNLKKVRERDQKLECLESTNLTVCT